MRNEPTLPFRWDLVRRRDRLGAMLGGQLTPDLWFLPELIDCAALVLARCGDGDLHFVGRSADSVYDLLSGALETTSWRDRIHLMPFSCRLEEPLTPLEVRQVRTNLHALGVSPYALARRRRPVVFVDLVYRGYTFTHLYGSTRAGPPICRAAR